MSFPTRWRDAVAFSWLAFALLYTIYTASTYTGLYEWLAEREISLFGSYDPTELFLAMVVVSVVSAGRISPRPFGASATWLKSTAVDPSRTSGSSATAFTAIATASLLVAIGSFGLAFLQNPQNEPLAEVNLRQSGAAVPLRHRLLVTGEQQVQFTVVVDETINGSTTRTAYTPVTPPNWHPGEPVRFVTRESLGEGDQPTTETPRAATSTVRFGPAAVFRQALPGIVRVRFKHSGLTVATGLLVLDTNLQSASETLWVVAVFASLFAVASFVLLITVRRAQRNDEAATAAERAFSLRTTPAPSAIGPQTSSPVRHWELRLGGELLAELFFQGYVFPWIEVSVTSRPGMEPFWRYFNQGTWTDHDAILDAMIIEIRRRGGFTLIPDGEAPTQQFTLANLDIHGGDLRC
jgi:hypothetical protein